MEDDRTTFKYVLKRHGKLSVCVKLAAQNTDEGIKRYKSYFSLKLQDRQFKLSDEVFVLLPSKTNKLLISWAGPYLVLEQRGEVDYVADHPRGTKVYHAILIKQCHRRTCHFRLSTWWSCHSKGRAIGWSGGPYNRLHHRWSLWHLMVKLTVRVSLK